MELTERYIEREMHLAEALAEKNGLALALNRQLRERQQRITELERANDELEQKLKEAMEKLKEAMAD